MNADLLTIDNMVAGLSNALCAQQRHDTGARDKPICPLADDKPARASSSKVETADNVAADAGQAVGEKPAREFREVLREKAENKGPEKNQNSTEPKERAGVSDPAKPSVTARAWLAEDAVPALRSTEGTAVKTEPQAGREPAQLIASLKTGKSPPITGHAAKSAEIKLALLAGEKGRLGLKTVLPENSNGQNGLKTLPPDAPRMTPAHTNPIRNSPPQAQPAVDTRAFANKEHVKEPMPEVAGQTDGTEKKAVRNAVSVPPTGKTPAADAGKDVIRETVVEDGGRRTAADGKKASVKTDLPAIQANLIEKQPQSQASSPGKRAPAAQPSAEAGAQQASSRSSDRSGKESEHAGNGPSNAPAFQKLNAGEVHVSGDQAKDQGRPAGAKNPSANFEQILSHGPQAPAAQQSAASAASARPANPPGQTPANDVAADIGRQILESLHGSPAQQKGDHQITVRLNPPELGKVFIKLQERDAELTGVLEVSRAQIRAEIEQALPQIIRNLADCGIQVRRFDVVLSEQGRSGQDGFGGQSSQNSGPDEHDSTNREAWPEEASFREAGEWSPSNAGYERVCELQEAFVGDGSINMLM